jgi:hypothetical protein
MTHSQFVLSMIVNGFVAVGTVGAVIVALFFDHLRAKFWPPTLNVSLLSDEGEKVDFDGGTGVEGRFYHLRIENGRRWSPATSVGLHLLRFEKRGVDGNFEPEWAGDVQIRCRNQWLYSLQREIGSPVDYDICSVKSGQNPELQIYPIVRPNNLTVARSGGWEFVAWFQAKSTQVDSRIIGIQVLWDGAWHSGDKEMKTHLKITPVPPVPPT